jgi:hypothetical protein
VGKTTLARSLLAPDSPNWFDLEDPQVEAQLAAPMVALKDLSLVALARCLVDAGKASTGRCRQWPTCVPMWPQRLLAASLCRCFEDAQKRFAGGNQLFFLRRDSKEFAGRENRSLARPDDSRPGDEVLALGRPQAGHREVRCQHARACGSHGRKAAGGVNEGTDQPGVQEAAVLPELGTPGHDEFDLPC